MLLGGRQVIRFPAGALKQCISIFSMCIIQLQNIEYLMGLCPLHSTGHKMGHEEGDCAPPFAARLRVQGMPEPFSAALAGPAPSGKRRCMGAVSGCDRLLASAAWTRPIQTVTIIVLVWGIPRTFSLVSPPPSSQCSTSAVLGVFQFK